MVADSSLPAEVTVEQLSYQRSPSGQRLAWSSGSQVTAGVIQTWKSEPVCVHRMFTLKRAHTVT